jgi:hypothetical protein
MKTRRFIALAVAGIAVAGAALGGCTNRYDRGSDTGAARSTDSYPANPYSVGPNRGFSDPGPNYPPTGH